MAGVAALATVAVFFGGVEPRNSKPKKVVEQAGQRLGPLQALRAGSMIILKSTWTVFRIRSFQVILAAGIVGVTPPATYSQAKQDLQDGSKLQALTELSIFCCPGMELLRICVSCKTQEEGYAQFAHIVRYGGSPAKAG